MNINNKTQTIVGLGLLTAIVVVLQALSLSIPVGIFRITLVLVPIIVGAALYGVFAGAWLGFIFSLVVMFTDTALFMAVSIPGTIITVMVKGTMAGIVAGLVYKALVKKSKFLAVLLAGIAAPVTNTGLFLVGCGLFFMDTINEWAAGAGYASAGRFMIFGLVGMNFVIELIINLAMSTTIVQLIGIGRKSGAVTAEKKEIE
ncbi:MAG: ECF transporter S component [Lachnospiraceae bacterium]|nr:ECF transporter S component [Lachnospiraceae bacterium]